MKTTRYIMASIMLVGLLATAEAQAKIGSLSIRIGRSPQVVRHTPPAHHKSSVFVPMGRRPHVSRRILVPPIRPVVIHKPAPVIISRPAPIVVPAPVIAPAPTLTVWITNGNGSRSPVVLKIDGPWYIGPRGERYATLPSEDQLRPVYGLDCGPVEPEEVTVYINTDSGILRRITLTRTAGGYRGPNGELYSDMPTEEQLRMAYGR